MKINFIGSLRKIGHSSLSITIPYDIVVKMNLLQGTQIKVVLDADTSQTTDTASTNIIRDTFNARARRASKSSYCVTLTSVVCEKLNIHPGDLLKIAVEKEDILNTGGSNNEKQQE